MGLFGAFATGVATWLRRRWSLPVSAFLLLVLPVAWGVSEWMRGWVFTGFPWVASGYAHNDSPLAGYAPLVGVYGIGAIAALCAGCIVMLTQRARGAGHRPAGRRAWRPASASARSTGPRRKAQPITVRLVQGNVAAAEQIRRRARARARSAMYRDMVTAAPADLIALPETALAVFPQHLPPGYLASLQAVRREQRQPR